MNQRNIRILKVDYLEKSTPHPIFSKSYTKSNIQLGGYLLKWDIHQLYIISIKLLECVT